MNHEDIVKNKSAENQKNIILNKEINENCFVKFYSKWNISPVKQNIDDINIHLKRREKLYRTLGVPPLLFKDRTILEVGPGSGYNTLAFFSWGAKVDLVEPNEIGQKEMMTLFKAYLIPENSYEIYPVLINEFSIGKKYQLIIAEGFIPNISDQEQVIRKLIDLTDDGAIIVITCIDEMGLFIEQLKRLVGHILVRDIHGFYEKISVLVPFYQPQFENLFGMSRNVEDWVKDQILNPAINNNLMGLSEAIDYFGDAFDVLGTSQNIYTDYSWYKDIEYDYKKDYKAQYIRKRHNFLMAGLKETIMTEADSKHLHAKINEIRNAAILYESTFQESLIEKVVLVLEDILPLTLKIDKKMHDFVQEAIQIFTNIMNKNIRIDSYANFFFAFGRGQQYLSMIKKKKY